MINETDKRNSSLSDLGLEEAKNRGNLRERRSSTCNHEAAQSRASTSSSQETAESGGARSANAVVAKVERA